MTYPKPSHGDVQTAIRAQAPGTTGEIRQASTEDARQSLKLRIPRSRAARVAGAGLAVGMIALASVFSFGGGAEPVDAAAPSAAEAALVVPEPALSTERAGSRVHGGAVLALDVFEAALESPAPAPVAVELPEWVRSTGEVAVWSHAQEPSKELGKIEEGSRLRVISQRDDSRALVHFENPDPKGKTVTGWVDRSQLEPADALARVTASSRGGERMAPETERPDQFIASVLDAAQESERTYGVPTSVIIAQAIIESGWGRSGLAKNAHNYFGIKANKPGPAGVVNMQTMEVERGAAVTITAGFKAYNSAYESFLDHGRFLSENPRYSEAFKTKDAREFVRKVHAAGYATDPSYTSKLINTMDHYDLYRFNVAQLP
jgi:flagellum-specific peptidoglycan hydrolase FlgJ